MGVCTLVYLLKSYYCKVRRYRISHSAARSGLTCIAFFLSLPISGRIHRAHVKKLINFVLLYLVVDYRLDDPKTCRVEKIDFLLQLLENRSCLPRELLSMYSHLVPTREAEEIFNPVLLTTATSFLVQYNSDSSPAELFAACCDKGSSSVLSGYRLIYSDCENAEITDDQLSVLGACIQLLDDIADCSGDRRDGIYTIATWCLREYGYLDNLARVLWAYARTLDGLLTQHRQTIYALLGLCIHRSGNFSPRFREKLKMSRYKKR